MIRSQFGRLDEPELLDAGRYTPEQLAQNLADMRAANRWAGGVRLTLRALARLTEGMPPGAELALLDLASGSGDLPRAAGRWALRRGLRPRLTITDLSPEIVRLAADEGRRTKDEGPTTNHQPPTAKGSQRSMLNAQFAVADACRLPFGDASFDVAMCSFALHHLPPEGAVAMLREMGRVARRGVIVNDLVRWRPFYWAVWLVCHLTSRNPLTRNDGPLSVLRAYTRAEMDTLLAWAGLRRLGAESFLGYRVALRARRER